jgi:hypothetical protein
VSRTLYTVGRQEETIYEARWMNDMWLLLDPFVCVFGYEPDRSGFKDEEVSHQAAYH